MEADRDGPGYTISFRMRNSRSRELRFYLEPWGEQYKMAPDATLEIVAQGPPADLLEVELGDDHVTVYGWPGSVVTLFDRRSELGAGLWARTPVPRVPRSNEK